MLLVSCSRIREGFGLNNVPPAKVRKRRIKNYATVIVVSRQKRKYIFGEDGILVVFYMHDCIFHKIWKRWRCSMPLLMLDH